MHPRTRAKLALQWLRGEFLAESERWILWLPVAFGCGICLYFILPEEPGWWPSPAALLVTGSLGLALGRGGRPWLARAMVPFLIAAAGFGACQLRTLSVAAPIMPESDRAWDLGGHILAIEHLNGRFRLRLDDLRIENLARDDTPVRVRVSTPTIPTGLQPGARVRLRAVLRPPPEPAAPHAFDFARKAYFEGLGGVGFALGGIEVTGDAGPERKLETLFSNLRHIATRRIREALPGDEGAIAAALLTGERRAISESTLEEIRIAGLAHLLAISGLHVGLVASMLFVILRSSFCLIPRIALNHHVKKWSAVAAALGALAYVMLVGATVPAERAFLMVLIVLAAILIDRTALSMRLVAAAAFAILAVAPESLLSVSFQLSFAAVTALVAAYETHRERESAAPERLRGLPRYVLLVAATSLIAGIATAPFAAFHFHRLVSYGLAANLIAVPLTAFWIMPWGVLALALMPFGAHELGLVPMGLGISGLLAVAKTVAGLPHAEIGTGAFPVAALGLIVLGGLWFSLWTRAWRWAGPVAGLVGVGLAVTYRPPDLLATQSAELMGARSGARLALTTLRSERFAANVWRRRLAAGEVTTLAEAAKDPNIGCDSLGCSLMLGNRRASIVFDERALMDDCGHADLLLARIPVPRELCPQSVVVDRFDLWWNGAHAIWLHPDSPRIEAVNCVRGARPWVRRRQCE